MEKTNNLWQDQEKYQKNLQKQQETANSEAIKAVETSQGSHQCYVCRKYFPDEGNLDWHRKSIHCSLVAVKPEVIISEKVQQRDQETKLMKTF